jgi:tellurite resistance protein TehA-like permease
MDKIGVVVFYIGFFGFFLGLAAMVKGNIEMLRINNRKQALKIIGLSVLVAFIGLLIIGPGHSPS